MDRVFRFAVFINAASPLRVFSLDDVTATPLDFDTAPLTDQAKSMYLRPSALRKKDGVSEEDQVNHEQLLNRLENLKGMVLDDGTPFLSDGKYGLCRWEVQSDGEPLIDVPTVHIRSTEEELTDPHHGLHLLNLCDKEQAVEYHHAYGHDFPRGRAEMDKIAQMIRKVAEKSQNL